MCTISSIVFTCGGPPGGPSHVQKVQVCIRERKGDIDAMMSSCLTPPDIAPLELHDTAAIFHINTKLGLLKVYCNTIEFTVQECTPLLFRKT